MKSLMILLLRLLVYFVLAFLAIFIVWQTVVRIVRRHWHFPAPWFVVQFLNNPLRRKMQPPQLVVGWLDVRKGMQVLEVGPGVGTFTLEAARRAGPTGHVYGCDIQAELIERLERNARKAGLSNVTAKVASAYDLPLPDASMDRVFMVTVLAEIPDRQRALAEFRRVLKPDGLLGIGELVPDPDFPLPRTVKRWCQEAGFELVADHRAPLHYLLLFRKV